MSHRIDATEPTIATQVQKHWESDPSFHDLLYDWMGRAPWLALSVAAHLLIFFIVQAIPWNLLEVREEKALVAQAAPAPQEQMEDPPEEPEPVEEIETLETPTLMDYDLSESIETPDEAITDSSEGDPDLLSDSPFDDEDFAAVLGIGPGAGGRHGTRFDGGNKPRALMGQGIAQSLKDGLEWLKAHQSPDGSWDADGFMTQCGSIGTGLCDMPGQPQHDVGLTGLCLLAFLGDGNTLNEGPYQKVVRRGIQWLRQQQDPETGLLGPQAGESYLYDHAIATLALSEAYYFSRSPMLEAPCRKAVQCILRARNPYAAWRYDLPATGDNDTSVTGWMVFALKGAAEAGIEVPREAFAGALAWIEEVSDPRTGRVGYDRTGSLSSRIPGINDNYPAQKGEAMTAVGLLCRFFLDQDPKDTPIMHKHADLLLRALPEWDVAGQGCDMYYWYYGSYAMYQMGGRHWEAWNRAMKGAILEHQRQAADGDLEGSWDPVGPWGWSGGRVYSTALMVLCLEVYFRYGRVLGAR